jgi:hypothetical protein
VGTLECTLVIQMGYHSHVVVSDLIKEHSSRMYNRYSNHKAEIQTTIFQLFNR